MQSEGEVIYVFQSYNTSQKSLQYHLQSMKIYTYTLFSVWDKQKMSP